LSSASAAALTAVPGGTVTKATTETDSSNTSAAYEVHITKSDGSKVLVVEDSSFTVLSTAADAGCAGHGGGGDPGRNGGPPH
jgi:outer membrane lipoprotein SlyB